LCIKPSIDDRDGEDIIKSRIGLSRECISFDTTHNLYKFIDNYIVNVTIQGYDRPKWILVDECQFLSKEQVDQLAEVVDNLGINVMCYGLRTDFKSDLFENVEGKFDFIISNPPYIESSVIETLDEEVKSNEPILALDGGEDGLDFYREIVETGPKHLNKGGKLYFEIGYNQAEALKNLMKDRFKDIEVYKDYGNNDRVVVGEIL
jgi:methylase of polypeptide subunit release factors